LYTGKPAWRTWNQVTEHGGQIGTGVNDNKGQKPAPGIQAVVVPASGACATGSPEEVEQFITDQYSSDSQVCD